MLDLAGVLFRGLLLHADGDKEIRQKQVPFIGAPGDEPPLVRQHKAAAGVQIQIAAAAQKAHGAAHARLGKAHILGHIHRPHAFFTLGQNVDRLQIHFAGFL